MSQRQHILQHVVDAILDLPHAHILRVAIDGVGGAGKTTFADELSRLLAFSGRQVIRASVDAFHYPFHLRYKQGEFSPDGFFHDAYNYEALKNLLLIPLSPGGTRRFRREVFDDGTHTPINGDEEVAKPDAILVFDGIFLHRPELRHYWDFSVFLDVSFTVSLPRYALRDGTTLDPSAPLNRRYSGADEVYLEECKPQNQASLVINNEDLEQPYIVQPIR
jgi:uridine kinase